MSDIVTLVGELTAVRGQRDALMVEIERLRADVVHWREARRMCIAAGDMMKAEIERLREEVFDAHQEIARLHKAGMDAREKNAFEIERLKEAIRQHKLNVWGVTVCHEEDKKLYEVIGE